MNTKKKIEHYLHAAPKPQAPEGLLDSLKEDVSATEVKTRRSTMRRWLAPGGSVSFRRIACAAVIAVIVMLPLSYGATKAVKYLITTTFEAKFEYPEDNMVYSVKTSIFTSGDNIQSEEDARKAEQEFYRLYKEGKAKEVKPGVWVATLSNGEKFAYGGNPESLGLSDTEKKELLKKQFDEIHELRKVGKFEKTYKPEHDFVVDGVKYRYFEARFTLSDGKVITIGASEPAEDDGEK